MKIAVIGAGAIGTSVTNACHAAGHNVQLVGRRRAPLEELAQAGDTIVTADVAADEGCRAALAGADMAVYALGLPYSKAAFADYPGMMRSFVAAARAQGIRRAVLITNVYAYGRPQSAHVSEEHPRIPCSVKGQFRKEQEDIFLDAAGQGFESISLRLPDFYGPRVRSSLMDMAVQAAAAGKAASLLGPADTPHEFVFTPDVGPVVAALLTHAGATAGAYNLAGSGVITQRQLATHLFDAAGTPAGIRVMPPFLQDLVGLFMPVLRELREMRYLHETPVLLDDAKLRALLPGLAKTPYAEGARLAIAAERARPGP